MDGVPHTSGNGQARPLIEVRGLTKTYGLGVTVHTPTSTVVRLEVARTPNGTSLGFTLGPSF